MIEFIIWQPRDYPAQQKEKLMGHERVYGNKWKQLPRNQHPKGRHPFNILTKEVLSD